MKFIKKIIIGLIAMIPNISSYQPITEEIMSKNKAARDSNILWADEI